MDMSLEEDGNIRRNTKQTRPQMENIRVSADDASQVPLDETQVVHLFGKKK